MSLSESCEGQKQRTGLWVGRWGLGFLTPPPQPACPEGGGERLLTLKGSKLGLQQWSKIHGRTGGGQGPQREKAKATVLEAGRWLDLGDLVPYRGFSQAPSRIGGRCPAPWGPDLRRAH